MTESPHPTTSPGTAAPKGLAAALRAFVAAIKRLPRMEFLIALIAYHILGGWLVQCLRAADSRPRLDEWFPLLSLIGAFVVALVITLKACRVRPLSPVLERRVLALACVLPGFGLLMKMFATPSELLTEGGSLLIACVGLAVFWHKDASAKEVRP